MRSILNRVAPVLVFESGGRTCSAPRAPALRPGVDPGLR